jgi:hypothetical protein
MSDLPENFEYTLHEPDSEHYQEPEYGQCCWCGFECNPASQACGRCMRNGPPEFDFKEMEVKEIKEVKETKVVPNHFSNILLQVKKEDRTCSICTFPLEDDMCLTSCFHLFHVKCLSEWKKHKQECPMCTNEI